MSIKFVNVVGLSDLYKGRTKVVKQRIHDFLDVTIKTLMEAYLYRTTMKFKWSDYSFNNEQRESIINFMKVNNIISVYSRGFSFGESVFKQSELIPSPIIFSRVKLLSDVSVTTEVKLKNKTLTINDNDSKIIKRYVKKIGDSVNIPLFRMKRIYSGEYGRGGRIYSPYQTMSNSDRQEIIKINGNDIVEVDYNNNHLNILLATVNSKFRLGDNVNGSIDNDLYSTFNDLDLDRKTIKKMVSVMINAERPLTAFISEFGSFKLDKQVSEAFINKFKEKFHELGDMKHGTELGMELQRFEGDVAVKLINECDYLGIPVLPVHDSLICEAKNQAIVTEMMVNVWNETIDSNNQTIKQFF